MDRTAKNRIKLLLLTASLSLTGTHRILVNLLEGLDLEKFEPFVAYKPEFSGPGNDLTAELTELGYTVFQLRGCHLFDLRGLWDLHNIVAQHHIDIIHCWDSLSIAARFIGKINGAKVIDSIGNPPVDMSGKEKLAKKISSIFLDGVIFQSKGSQELHWRHGANILTWCKEAVIYNSIDMQKIPLYTPDKINQARKKYSLEKNDIILSNLGMYNKQKSQIYLIEALYEVLKYYKNLKLFLIGWGEYENILREKIELLKLKDHVFLTGKKSRHEVFELLSVTNIYISSSLWEGLPIAVLEAMAFGVPVVATDVVGNREAVADNINGILVPPQNSSAIGHAILHLIENPKLKERLGQTGKEHVREIFSPERFLQQHQEFYYSLIKRV